MTYLNFVTVYQMMVKVKESRGKGKQRNMYQQNATKLWKTTRK